MTRGLARAAKYFASGHYEQAMATLEAADQSVAADHLRGLCRLHLGQTESAINLLARLSERVPRDGEIARNLAIACRRVGRLEDATAAYERAFESSKDRGILIQLAELDCERNQMSAAKSRLREIPRSDPHFAAAQATLASLHEQEGSDNQALAFADEALKADPENFKAGYVKVAVLIKQRRYNEALDGLSSLRPTTPVNVSLCAKRRADCLIALGKVGEGFREVVRGNQALASSGAVRRLTGTSHYGPDFLTQWSEYLTDERLKNWADSSEHADDEPVFLVGFPRSGTTLLERMLSMSRDIAVIEEQPTLAPLLSELDTAVTHGRPIADLSDLRKAYFRVVSQFVNDGRRVVDKMPLNSAFLALIYRLFPKARIVFAVRDPRAVCLSCFRQSFGLNEAMAQFLDWQQTARYYAQVMCLARKALDRLEIRHAFVRYESLVEQPRQALDPVLALLGVHWNDDMLRFHTRADGRINTPSYRQVSQPLYRGARDTWQEFPQIAEIKPLLDPWLAHWGYQ